MRPTIQADPNGALRATGTLEEIKMFLALVRDTAPEGATWAIGITHDAECPGNVEQDIGKCTCQTLAAQVHCLHKPGRDAA